MLLVYLPLMILFRGYFSEITIFSQMAWKQQGSHLKSPTAHSNIGETQDANQQNASSFMCTDEELSAMSAIAKTAQVITINEVW